MENCQWPTDDLHSTISRQLTDTLINTECYTSIRSLNEILPRSAFYILGSLSFLSVSENYSLELSVNFLFSNRILS